ncbi:HAD family hydrolase [Piscinibacter gummiphilus]|uniref:D,D-heptose 1,7-bisphosphate phosphatase n=1 Tax=Piscinibacter gummiphilus TaxID=946333 RepID=A0ABZ0CSS6_9BURK|nr:HAD family hydrolase [Piscinibacter gummiphilus]WOB06146.1 HAD family hydrolase [Piscinibacter gummiphilus]
MTSAFDDLRPEPPRSPAVFLDKDGTLVENVPYNVDPAKLRFTPHAFDGLRALQAAGFKLVVVTNQPGIAFHFFDRASLTRLQRAMEARLAAEGIELAGFYACPHAPAAPRMAGCLCRKPAPGLLHQAAQALHLDLARSWMVGDILDDIEAGQRAGCRSVLLDVGNETVWRMSPLRTPHARCQDLLQAADHILAASCAAPSASALAQETE